MKALTYYNVTTKAWTTGTGPWTPGTLTFGEEMTLGLRFQEDIDGVTSEISADVRYLKAAIGNVDLRPLAETFRLKVGDAPRSEANTTSALPWNAGAQEIARALNALTTTAAQYGQATVRTVDGSTILQFGSGAVDVPVEVVDNGMEPASIGVVNAWQVVGKWFAEVRLIQGPVAFCDSSARVLPPAPTVTEVQVGGSDGTFYWNEIQQMVMPPDFRGTYQFKFGNLRTVLLSRADGPDEVTSALAVFGDKITATNPRDAVARFEFGGNDFKGTPQPLLQIIVMDAPEGDLTFTLSLDKPPLAALLRTKASVTLPLEIEIGIGDDSVPSGIRKEKIRTEVTIQRGMIFDMLATAAGIDWLRPVAVDYVPFTRDQIIVGQLFWAGPIGDGTATVFPVDHNLDTDTIAAILVRENAPDGRTLVLGTDYTVTYGGKNSLTVTILGTAPAAEGLALVITAAGPAAVFQQHTHTMEQIVGLDGLLEQIGTRLTTLETFLPGTSPGIADASVPALTITIPMADEVLFFDRPAASKTLDLTALPVRAPYLLPAVHQAAEAVALPTPLPSALANSLWTAAARVLIPGTGRIASSYAAAGDYVASDGRILYPARRAGATTSYYPAPFERALFEFGINDDMLTLNRTLEVTFGVTAQLVHATSEAQWVLVIEQGVPVDQSDPANEDVNLQDVTWSATPILKKRILLTQLATLHTFGCRIKRTGATTLTADKMLYGSWSAATGAAPASANFVLRARLIEFDTKNNVPDATGWLYQSLSSVDGGKADTKATIS